MTKTLFAAGISCMLFFASTSTQAQVIDDNAGKTYYYYDSINHRKVKEIFHHMQVILIIPDKQHHGEYTDSITYVKDGPYTRYYENGMLECSGYYKSEKKDKTWKFYNTKGVLIRTEEWDNGTLKKS